MLRNNHFDAFNFVERYLGRHGWSQAIDERSSVFSGRAVPLEMFNSLVHNASSFSRTVLCWIFVSWEPMSSCNQKMAYVIIAMDFDDFIKKSFNELRYKAMDTSAGFRS